MIRFAIATAFILSFTTAAWAGGPARSFLHTVSSTASRVEPATGSKGYDFIRCWQSGASPVYLGGRHVNTREGYPICTNVAGLEAGDRADAGAKCESDAISLHTSDLFAVTSSGQQFLLCIASAGS